jgi:phospholipid/cholesterol/gamma-HCH transport system permease protein
VAIVRIGSITLVVLEAGGALLLRTGAVLRALVRGRVDGRETLRQLDRLMTDALPLMIVSSFVVGGIVAMQGLGYVRRYSASEVFGWAAGLSAYRDIGPLLLGCALAARTGARNTAEIAMMSARERLAAIRALGLDPERVLIAPRLVATVLVATLLYLPACTLVFVIGCALASIVGDQPLTVSLWSFVSYLEPRSIGNGLWRVALFGAVVGLASCHSGVSVEKSADRSAAAIGRAVYAGSVLSLAGVMLLNAALSLAGGTS